MGQKVNPNGLRLGVNKTWKSTWYAKKDYATKLNNDLKLRDFLASYLKDAAVADITIERKPKRNEIKIRTAKPGVIIGRGGEDIEKLRKEIKKAIGEDFYVTIVEEKNPNLSAQIVADTIAKQIENRANFRTVQKQAIKNVMKAGAVGVKTAVSGRLGGAEMARTEGYTEGTVPLHTIRADIDYAHKEADTIYGKIGVKVWIYKGEILPAKNIKKDGDTNVNAKKN